MRAAKILMSEELLFTLFPLPSGTRLLRATVTHLGELELVVGHEDLPNFDSSKGAEPPVFCPEFSEKGFVRWNR